MIQDATSTFPEDDEKKKEPPWMSSSISPGREISSDGRDHILSIFHTLGYLVLQKKNGHILHDFIMKVTVLKLDDLL